MTCPLNDGSTVAGTKWRARKERCRLGTALTCPQVQRRLVTLLVGASLGLEVVALEVLLDVPFAGLGD